MLGIKKNIRFTDTDFDEKGNIRASSLMFHFQEIAAEHADQLGIGYDELIKDNMIWVMSKLKFKVFGKPAAGRDYELSTYPRPRKGVTYYRDYYLREADGTLTAAGLSHWCVINFATRKIERTSLEFDGEYIDHVVFDEGIEKIKPCEPAAAGVHVVTAEDLDINEHTNNCRYADIVSELLGNSAIRSFNISFVQESRLGDRILLMREDTDEGSIVTGKLEDGRKVFQAEVRCIM